MRLYFFRNIVYTTIIVIGVNLLLNVELTKSINLKGETNDFCQFLNKSINNSSLEL